MNYNIEKVDELMKHYEDAKHNYECADFYDSYSDWSGYRAGAAHQMDEYNSQLIELTGKGYKELLKELGSKDTSDAKEPIFKVGDIVKKYTGKLFTITDVKLRESITRESHRKWYGYEVKELEGAEWDCFYEDDINERFTKASKEDLDKFEDNKRRLKIAEQSVYPNVGDKVRIYNFIEWREYEIFSVKATGNADNPVFLYDAKDPTGKYRNEFFTSDYKRYWEPVEKKDE